MNRIRKRIHLAMDDHLWHTRRVKRRTVVITLAVLCAAVVAAFFAVNPRGTQQITALPIPNGYDDFATAAQWIVAWNGDLPGLPPEGIRDVVNQNAKVLETVHLGLKKQSAVPVAHDMNWFNRHLVEMASHKQIAKLLIAEGMIHLEAGRTMKPHAVSPTVSSLRTLRIVAD